MSELGDTIIEVGPFAPGEEMGGLGMALHRSADLNELRDELIELRRLKAAAEAHGHFMVFVNFWNDTATLDHVPCGTELQLGDGDTLADLNQRADEHTEVCR